LIILLGNIAPEGNRGKRTARDRRRRRKSLAVSKRRKVTTNLPLHDLSRA
jgi:hypothetical protein